MSEAIQNALQNDQLVDITAIGRKSGEPHRFEIMLRRYDGQIYIVGSPVPKGWYANMRTKPEITLHLKQSVQADLPAKAVAIVDEAERRPILTALLVNQPMVDDLETWIAGCRLIRIDLES